MKLSLMLLNPAFPIFMNPDFTPKYEADHAASIRYLNGLVK